MDDVFIYIGNVKELILTGNEISSTRGLDRLFSLERLSLDENKIENLANIAGIAKLPFLMNFDLKGNPLEIDGKLIIVLQAFCGCGNLFIAYSDFLPVILLQTLLPVASKSLIFFVRFDASQCRKMLHTVTCNSFYQFSIMKLLTRMNSWSLKVSHFARL